MSWSGRDPGTSSVGITLDLVGDVESQLSQSPWFRICKARDLCTHDGLRSTGLGGGIKMRNRRAWVSGAKGHGGTESVAPVGQT